MLMSLLCHRCGLELHPGSGDFYEVRIEAVADPSPPRVTAEMLAEASAESMRAIVNSMKDFSEQELMDQVYRRMMIHLCRACYVTWIENPAGPASPNH
jgi:hypothetical protein